MAPATCPPVGQPPVDWSESQPTRFKPDEVEALRQQNQQLHEALGKLGLARSEMTAQDRLTLACYLWQMDGRLSDSESRNRKQQARINSLERRIADLEKMLNDRE